MKEPRNMYISEAWRLPSYYNVHSPKKFYICFKRGKIIKQNKCFEFFKTVRAKAVFASTKMFLMDGLTDFYSLVIYLLKYLHAWYMVGMLGILVFIDVHENSTKHWILDY